MCLMTLFLPSAEPLGGPATQEADAEQRRAVNRGLSVPLFRDFKNFPELQLLRVAPLKHLKVQRILILGHFWLLIVV